MLNNVNITKRPWLKDIASFKYCEISCPGCEANVAFLGNYQPTAMAIMEWECIQILLEICSY
jgi:hypothetical protein